MKETKIEAPEGCEIGKVEIVDGAAVVTFREKKRKLPKSWEEFCEMFPDFIGNYFIIPDNDEKIDRVCEMLQGEKRTYRNAELLPDRATAEAVLSLCQLIQLRNCYNGGWVPDWKDKDEIKHIIQFDAEELHCDTWIGVSASPLYFKTAELRDEFLRNFHPLIEKLKPLYGIKEGGEK